MQQLIKQLLVAAAVVLFLSTTSAYADLGDQLFKLLASDGASNDEFGMSVAINGTTAIVGARYEDSNGNNSGSAYLFDTTTGQQIFKLLPSDGAHSDEFGYFVAIGGHPGKEVAIVGAMLDDDNGSGSGSAYIFDITTGQQIAKLLPKDGEGGDRFGSAVAISGDVVIVGANKDDDNGPSAGSAYIFRFDPNTSEWVEEAKLLASDGSQSDWFGREVAIDHDVAIVGSNHNDDACPGDIWCDSGSAYIYRYHPDKSQWIEEAKLLASDMESHDSFGKAVSISGDVVMIGADTDDNGGSSGSVYVFRNQPKTSIWHEEAKLLASDGEALDNFGLSVSLSGNVAIIGTDKNGVVGAAYIYRYNHETLQWVEESILLANDGAVNDNFSFDVAISGPPGKEIAITGTYWDDDNGDASGSAYIFDASSTPSCPWDLDNSGIVDTSDLLALFAQWGTAGTADFDESGVVDTSDLLILFANWGPCP